jgi:hypothetical protein
MTFIFHRDHEEKSEIFSKQFIDIKYKKIKVKVPLILFLFSY